MHFIFGYSREVPVETERNPSKLALVGLALVVIALLIFLSFENLGRDTSIPPSIFEKSPSSDQAKELTGVEGIECEKESIPPEVQAARFTPEETSESSLASNQEGLK
jgi:hypothetical protein